MHLLKSNRNIIVKATKVILIIFLPLVILLFNKNLDLERLIKIHVEKEKRLGLKEVNQQLYLYNAKTPIDKFIITDYQYLRILPDLRKYFRYGEIQSLEPSSLIFNDESNGYLLWTPSDNNSKVVPNFVETRIESGQYKEVFNYKGYRFIKIR